MVELAPCLSVHAPRCSTNAGWQSVVKAGQDEMERQSRSLVHKKNIIPINSLSMFALLEMVAYNPYLPLNNSN
ncbi:MAG: hypothetical protein ACPGWR_19495 [Ardenticatenaceae bacterium]